MHHIISYPVIIPHIISVVHAEIVSSHPANFKSILERCVSYVLASHFICTDMRPGVEKIVWILDFTGYSQRQRSENSHKVSNVIMAILQDHYPERLAVPFSYPLMMTSSHNHVDPCSKRSTATW